MINYCFLRACQRANCLSYGPSVYLNFLAGRNFLDSCILYIICTYLVQRLQTKLKHTPTLVPHKDCCSNVPMLILFTHMQKAYVQNTGMHGRSISLTPIYMGLYAMRA